MRIALGAGLLAASFLIPRAAAQTAAYPLLERTPVLIASFTESDTLVTGARVRNRDASSMADFFPFDGKGFHLSAGLRFFEGRSMLRQNQKAMRDLVYLPRSVGNAGVHWGYRRVASMAVGYTQPLDEDVSIGFEVGEMMGRAINRGRRPGVRLGDGRRDNGPNSIVHVVLDVNF